MKAVSVVSSQLSDLVTFTWSQMRWSMFRFNIRTGGQPYLSHEDEKTTGVGKVCKVRRSEVEDKVTNRCLKFVLLVMLLASFGVLLPKAPFITDHNAGMGIIYISAENRRSIEMFRESVHHSTWQVELSIQHRYLMETVSVVSSQLSDLVTFTWSHLRWSMFRFNTSSLMV